MANLFNAAAYQVNANRTVATGSGDITWSGLLNLARAYDGWYFPLLTLSGNPSERVISKATVLGGIVFFPAYMPNTDICGFGGQTRFYATYYETGTAYYKHILPGTITTVTDGSGEGAEDDQGGAQRPPLRAEVQLRVRDVRGQQLATCPTNRAI